MTFKDKFSNKMVESSDFKINPKSITKNDLGLSMSEASFKKYKKTWLQFLAEENITESKAPTEKDVDNFLKRKKSTGSNFNTLKSIYR